MSKPKISLSFVELPHPVEQDIHVSQDKGQNGMDFHLSFVELLLLEANYLE